MNIEQLLDIVNKAIELAEFDRKRFRVRAALEIGAQQVDMHAYTLFHHPPGSGTFANNYCPIRLDDVTAGLEEGQSQKDLSAQLVDIVAGAVSGLEEFTGERFVGK